MGCTDATGCLHGLLADLSERSLLVLKKLLLLLLFLEESAIIHSVFGRQHALKAAWVRNLTIARDALRALCELLIL